MVATTFIDMDTLFHSVSTDKIILNDYVIENSSDLDDLKEKLNTIYKSDTISLLPRCNCGKLEGEIFKGLTCDECHTKVIGVYDDIDPFIWFKALEDIGPFISPEFWLIVRKAIGGNVDFLRWISDTQYNPPIENVTSKKALNVIKSIPGFERSYTWLINNMKTLLVVLATNINKPELRGALELFKEQKDKIFNNYLPLQNKRMFITEEAANSMYTNLQIIDVLDIVLFFIRNVNADRNNRRQQVMSRTCYDMANIFENSIRIFLSGKGGIPRKHINGFRSYFTSRAVIVPITSGLDYDMLELPWSIIVTMMRPHILNKLYRRGYTYIKANNILYDAVNNFDPLVNEIIDEMVKECPWKGFPVTINRNPSLLNGSTQTLFAVPKKDPKDKTIGLHILICKGFNADYDGDEMNVQLLIDDYLYKLFIPMAPHASVANMSKPGGISGRLSLTDPIVGTISNYLYHERQRLEKEEK